MAAIFVVDARSRGLSVFVASATSVGINPEGQQLLVLRKGTEVGSMFDMVGHVLEAPMFIVGSYQAKSSAGFTAVFGLEYGGCAIWIGGAGFGAEVWNEQSQTNVRRGGSLRPFGYPIKGTLLPEGQMVGAVETHRNSNPATAEATLIGLRLRAQINKGIVLVEGQSDVTSAWCFRQVKVTECPVFPPEHRSEMFTSERLLRAAIRRYARYGCVDDRAEQDRKFSLLLSQLIEALPDASSKLPPTIIQAVGGVDRLSEVALRLAQEEVVSE